LFVYDQVGHVLVDTTLLDLDGGSKLSACNEAGDRLDGEPDGEDVAGGMLAEDLPLLGCDGIRRFLHGLLKEPPVGPRVKLWHEYLHVLTYQVLFVLVTKDLA
jgi:hypothetical protein